jgi:hypothetical protein
MKRTAVAMRTRDAKPIALPAKRLSAIWPETGNYPWFRGTHGFPPPWYVMVLVFPDRELILDKQLRVFGGLVFEREMKGRGDGEGKKKRRGRERGPERDEVIKPLRLDMFRGLEPEVM